MNAKAISIITAFFTTAVLACMYPPKKFTEKKLVIGRGESAKISELNMTITNSGCGRKWMTDNGGEKPYCDLLVKIKDSTWHFGNSFDPFYINNLKLVIEKMNPWGREEDHVPPGGCRITITRLDDISR